MIDLHSGPCYASCQALKQVLLIRYITEVNECCEYNCSSEGICKKTSSLGLSNLWLYSAPPYEIEVLTNISSLEQF